MFNVARSVVRLSAPAICVIASAACAGPDRHKPATPVAVDAAASPTPVASAPTPITTTPDPPTATAAIVTGRRVIDRAAETLGDPAIDDVVRRIEAHDVASLADHVTRVRVYACDGAQPDGVYEGRADVEAALRGVLPEGGHSTLFSAVSSSTARGGPIHDRVTFADGSAPVATAAASLWSIDPAAMIFEVQTCRVSGGAGVLAGLETDALAINATHLIPPGGTCLEGATRTRYRVKAAARVSDAVWTVAASEESAVGETIARNAFAWANAGSPARHAYPFGSPAPFEPRTASLEGGPTTFADITAGMLLEIEGWRYASCQIEAWRIVRIS